MQIIDITRSVDALLYLLSRCGWEAYVCPACKCHLIEPGAN